MAEFSGTEKQRKKQLEEAKNIYKKWQKDFDRGVELKTQAQDKLRAKKKSKTFSKKKKK